jgi:hypothetical protein
MRPISLDASGCRTIRQFCGELKQAIEAFPGHGNSIEAFVDSMVWGAMSDLPPPYTILVGGLQPGPVADFAQKLSEALGHARIDRRDRRGEDVEVVLQLVR